MISSLTFPSSGVVRSGAAVFQSLFMAAVALFIAGAVNASEPDDEVAELSMKMLAVFGDEKSVYIDKLAALEDKSLIPTFVLGMRWTRGDGRIAKALSTLAGEEISTWHQAYQWQERHPEITPHPSFRDLKLWYLAKRDKRFVPLFQPPHGTREKMRIRFEEVVWGGTLYDGIPPLESPSMIAADDADYLLDDDLVFGVNINGDIRAYPLRIMGWHEMLNDTIGDVPVSLAYCTLCGSGILYETQVKGRDKPFDFGSSGLLYRSNKLMLDRETASLWNQFSGEPVVGSLAQSGIKLNIRPMAITTWSDWKSRNPRTTVLSLETGFARNYDSGFVYHRYFTSPNLMFPASVGDESVVARKDYIFGLRNIAGSKAWPLEVFGDKPIINDKVGRQSVVLIGDITSRSVRAYERDANEVFELMADNSLVTNETVWEVQESFLVSADGKSKRARVAGHLAYWFAWDSFVGLSSELYQD